MFIKHYQNFIPNKLKSWILDLVFPKFCLSCHKEADWLCGSCKEQIIQVKTQICPNCARVSSQGKYCPKCRKGHSLTGILVSTYFEEGPVRELIHNFKYNHVLEIGDFLGEIMVQTLKENLAISSDFIITAVPLHWLRKSSRGYNQSEILGQMVAKKLKLPYQNLLIKKRKTERQVGLKGKERRENLQNIFALIEGENIVGKTIILVDDITTTGTTLNECAKVLKENGAKRVWGLVLAKG